MTSCQTSIEIDRGTENIYAGFWLRLGAIIIDILITMPFFLLIHYLNGLDKNAYFFTLIPSLIFGIWYYMYLVKKYGGTPGKLITGIKIIKMNGEDVTWREAILRESISILFTIFLSVITILSLLNADAEYYESLGWRQKSQYLMTFSPLLFTIADRASRIWSYSELIILLTNKKRRALHDFIAGTVVVKNAFKWSISKSI